MKNIKKKQAADNYYKQFETYPDTDMSETSLYNFIDISGNSIGHYINNNGHTVYEKDYLVKSNTACEEYRKKYPKGNYVLKTEQQEGINYGFLGEASYSEDDLVSMESNYQSSNIAWKKVITDNQSQRNACMQAQRSIAENNKKLARNFKEVSNDNERVDEYYDQAVIAYQTLINEYTEDQFALDRAKAQVSIGECLFFKEDYHGAVSHLDTVITQYTGQAGYEKIVANSQYIEGESYYAEGDFENALKSFEVSRVQAAFTALSDLGIGNSYRKMGQNDKAIEAYDRVIKLNDYKQIEATCKAYIYAGKCSENLENFQDAFKYYAEPVVKYPVPSSKADLVDVVTGIIQQAKKGIDRVVKIDIEQDTEVDENGNVTVNLATTPKYPDGTDFTVLGTHEWKWEIKGGEGELTENGNLAVVKTDLANFGSMATEAKLGLDLSAYVSERNRAGYTYWLHGVNPFSPLREIVNKNVDYLIYDEKGYKDNKNIVFPGSSLDLWFVGGSKGEPIAAKHGDEYPLSLSFAPNKSFDYCNIEYQVTDTKETTIVTTGKDEFPISNSGETKQEIKILTPDKLGKYILRLKASFSKKGQRLFSSDTVVKSNLYVLYDKPKYEEDIAETKTIDKYRLNKNQFIKKNIDWTFKDCDFKNTDIRNICEVVYSKTQLNLNFYEGTAYHHINNPWMMVTSFLKNKGDCLSWATLMAQELNVLGINATTRCIGDIPDPINKPETIRKVEVSMDITSFYNYFTNEIKIENIKGVRTVGTKLFFPLLHAIHIYNHNNQNQVVEEEWNYEGVCYVDDLDGLCFDVAETKVPDIRKYDEMLKDEHGSWNDYIPPSIPGTQPPYVYEKTRIHIKYYFWEFELISPINGLKFVIW